MICFLKNHLKIIMETFKNENAKLAEGKILSKDYSKLLEAEMIKKDESIVLVEMLVSFIFDKDGKAVGLSGITRDITDRKQLESQLIQSQKMESVGRACRRYSP